MSKSKLVDEIGQFTIVPNWVVDMGGIIGPDALALYTALRYFGEGAFPSYDTIQLKTGLTRRRIANAIRKLETNGLLERRRRFGASTVYTLKMRISTDAGLVEPTISTDAVLPLVQQVHTNKTQLTRLIQEVEEEEEKPPQKDAKYLATYQGYTDATGQLITMAVQRRLDVITDRYPLEWITAAFEAATLHGGRTLAYIESVLQSWGTNGFRIDTRKQKQQPAARYPQRQESTLDKIKAYRAQLENEQQTAGVVIDV